MSCPSYSHDIQFHTYMILSKYQKMKTVLKIRKCRWKRKIAQILMLAGHFFASQCWYKFKTLPGKLNRVHKKSKPQFNFFQLKFDFSTRLRQQECSSQFRRQKCHEIWWRHCSTINAAGYGKRKSWPAAILHAMRSQRPNVVFAHPSENYFLGSMPKTSVNHTGPRRLM